MKGIIIYYSNTGNTLLVCKYLGHKLTDVDFDLYSIRKQKKPDLNKYDIVGFFTFTNSWEPPALFTDYIMTLEKQNNKPAFLLNTYGFISGKTLKMMEHFVLDRGFLVMCGHSLKTPENVPLAIRWGLGGANHPGKREVKKFNNFIHTLEQFIKNMVNHNSIFPGKIRIGLFNTLLPPFPKMLLCFIMGEKKVDAALCIECGECKKNCPVQAISLDPKPLFDEDLCCYCWTCYNKCPEKAIYTAKYKGRYHYPGPNDTLKKKFGIE